MQGGRQQPAKVFHLPAIGETTTMMMTRTSTTNTRNPKPMDKTGCRSSTCSAPASISSSSSARAPPVALRKIDSTRPLNRTRRGKGKGANDTADAQLWGAVALMSHMSKSFSTRGVGPTLHQRTVSNAGPRDTSSPAPGVQPRPQRSSERRHHLSQPPSAIKYDPRRPTGYNETSAFPGSNAHLNLEMPKVKLSLAQKMGLVEAPPPPPQEEVWEVAQKKAVHRGDSLQPCAICHESFASDIHDSRAQVILDCSHVFHHTCLQQFEKFQRKVQGRHWVRQCPVCRHAHYHKRVHYAGKAQIQRHAVAKIQSLFRGVIARKRYLQLRLQTNPQFKSDFYFKKLSDMSDAYFNYAVAREKEVDKFLDEVDLQRQRAVAEMMSPDEWQCLRERTLLQLHASSRKRNETTSRIEVGGTVVEVSDRHDGEVETGCPICMNSILPEANLDGSEGHEISQSDGGPCLLSCGHCFHAKCLETFEKFSTSASPSQESSSSSTKGIPRCPLCRAGYVKSTLFV